MLRLWIHDPFLFTEVSTLKTNNIVPKTQNSAKAKLDFSFCFCFKNAVFFVRLNLQTLFGSGDLQLRINRAQYIFLIHTAKWISFYLKK